MASASCRRAPPATRVDDGAAAVFAQHDVEGAFILLDITRGPTVTYGNVDEGALPCSTFKIPNTLIGLETGAIPNERFALKWDGKVHPYEAWNRDHDLASAMQNSVVWYYQEVARRVGNERMKVHLNGFSYGNKNMSAGLDQFWLRGPMRISPRGQVEFLTRLRARTLPVAHAHMELVERILPTETSSGYTLRYKTGLGTQDERAIGWVVGFVDHGADAWAFATFVRGKQDDEKRIMGLRLAMTRSLLARNHAWPG